MHICINTIILTMIVFTLYFMYLIYDHCKGKGLSFYFFFIWALFSIIPFGLKIIIIIRLLLFALNMPDFVLEYFLNSKNLPSHGDFANILNPTTSGGGDGRRSPLPNEGGGGGNGSTIIPLTSETNSQLEAKRIQLSGKIEQLVFSFDGPNSGKVMNSPRLVNLHFTDNDREYMKFHLDKFHSTYSENQFGMVRGKGFSCKVGVSRDIGNMFLNRNV
jgi:hypothetical protein